MNLYRRRFSTTQVVDYIALFMSHQRSVAWDTDRCSKLHHHNLQAHSLQIHHPIVNVWRAICRRHGIFHGIFSLYLFSGSFHAFFVESKEKSCVFLLIIRIPIIPSMYGTVYLPTFTIKNQPDPWYGMGFTHVILVPFAARNFHG